ncbi:hypothetical protein MMC30_005074 [Trapelia coarctata]|nr:hypothetical protein [Trapelia coarctata]
MESLESSRSYNSGTVQTQFPFEQPHGLDIDQALPLENTKPPYDRHLVISTGRPDWTSRIEDDETSPNLAKGLKALMGAKGPLYDPEKRILISNSNFRTKAHEPEVIAGYLFPDYKYFLNIDLTEDGQARFVTDVLQSSKVSGFEYKPIETVTVLICGHGGRDQRCGVLGPLLETEFRRLLSGAGMMPYNTGNIPREAKAERRDIWRYDRPRPRTNSLRPRVARVSHVGGHKWAGNVIIYFPPQHLCGLLPSPLAGRGIWYGRVEPKHVEGIINETINEGKVIKELFRGVMEPNRMFLANSSE